MQASRFALLLVLPTVIAACSKATDPPASPEPLRPVTVAAPAAHEDAIEWRRGDVDAAFAEAKAARKPVFLYWGAAWCPPCNQVKATLFRQRAFIERTRYFVPVYVDGDTPQAQKLGTRFAVSGYPTMVLFTPDGAEITRLPGEAEPDRYLDVLALGMNAARPVGASLAAALAGAHDLGPDDWRMLAWYSWDTDDQRLVPTARVATTLAALAAKCPADQPATRARLALKAAAALGDAPAGNATKTAGFDRQVLRAEVDAVLGSPASAREQFDLLTNAMPEIVRATTRAGSPERTAMVARADTVLAGLASDTSLSNTDRLDATVTRVQLATLDVKADLPDGRQAPVRIPAALRETVVAEVARTDRESHDPYERQTVVNAAAYLLTIAGMIDQSDALLEAELARSHSPYYFMLDLASNARKRGDKAAAIAWYARAYDASEGPATRLQWGATYVGALVDLAPDDAGRIEAAASRVLGEVAPAPESFEGRNRKSLSRMSKKIVAWNDKGKHAAAAGRVVEASRALCGRLAEGAPERTQCAELLGLAPSKDRKS